MPMTTAVRSCGVHAWGHAPRRAMTLAEAVISIAIVATLLLAAIQTVGASRSTQQRIAERTTALLLAEDLVTEIVQQHYEDPALPGSFGVGADEATGDRSLFEDVDDYDGWSASPPEHKDGTPFGGLDGWERTVDVEWMNPTLTATDASDTGIKRIVVRVFRNGAELAVLTALRSRAISFIPEEVP